MDRESFEVSIRKKELEIRGLPRERCYVFDREGEILFRKDGEPARILFSDRERDLMADAVLTHNHPREGSFSPEDVRFACANRLMEMRVAAARYAYSVRPPEAGWSEKYWTEVLLKLVRRHDRNKTDELFRAIIACRITNKEAEERHWHEIWETISRETGLLYSRRSW